jgi:hypothetical protein
MMQEAWSALWLFPTLGGTGGYSIIGLPWLSFKDVLEGLKGHRRNLTPG